jgi:transposase-like protein
MRILLNSLFFLLTLSLAAQEAANPAARDPKIDLVASDLHALGRIATVAEDLGRSRQVLLAIVDSDISDLRMPRENGTYRWASLQREEGGRVDEETTVEQVHSEATLKNVTMTGSNVYRVLVTVPQKRGVFTTNNRVYVRNLLVDSTGFDGKTSHQEIPVNAWVNPGDANGVALADIGKSVKVTTELGVESGDKKAVAEVALVQARLADDPGSPYFPAVTRLLQIRDLADDRDINRGTLRNTIDESLLSLPGELEKRTADQAEAARVRKLMVENNTTTGNILAGDATPDVIAELAEITRLAKGTVDEQAAARTRMEALVTALRPAVTAQQP